MSDLSPAECLARLADEVFFKVKEVQTVEAKGAGRVTMRRLDGDLGAVTIALDPPSSDSASAVFHLLEATPVVSITIGRASIFEVPLRGRGGYSELPFIEEIGAFVRAITRGDVHEELWMQGERIVKDRCSICLDGRWVTNVRYIGGNPLRRKTKTEVQWRPYRRGDEDHES